MKKIHIIYILVIIVSALTLNSCLNILCVNGNGIAETETRNPGEFTAIINTTDADVIYHTSEEFSVTVKADANLITYYKTEIEGNSLEIITRGVNCMRHITHPVINVYAPVITELKSTGSGDIIADTITGTETGFLITGSGDVFVDYCESGETDISITGSGDMNLNNSVSNEINITISGSGDCKVTGDAETGHFTTTGSGNNQAYNLYLDICNASISGSGDIYTTVLNELYVSLTGSGNLYLKGDPEIYKTITGSGRIVFTK